MPFLVKSHQYPLILHATEYWMRLFGSVLACIGDHKLLEHRPDRLGLDSMRWSLRDFRGQAPVEAFGVVKASLRNWAFQYLMIDVLNATESKYIAWLKDGLSQLRQIDLSATRTEAYISGADSRSAAQLAELRGGRLLFDLRRSFDASGRQVRHTDLCIFHYGARDYPVVALGEVEGGHGERVRRAEFWGAKSPALNFGIGIVDGEGVTCEFVETVHGRRFVMLFGANRGLADDYMTALDYIGMLLRDGPNGRGSAGLQPGLREAFQYFARRFGDPVVAVLEDLRACSILCEQDREIHLLVPGAIAPAVLRTPQTLRLD